MKVFLKDLAGILALATGIGLVIFIVAAIQLNKGMDAEEISKAMAQALNGYNYET